MQVITFSPKDVEDFTHLLYRYVEIGPTPYYDAIVGVKRGGSLVCDAFCHHFPKSRYGARFDVKLQRPSTKRKDEKLSKALKLLPYFLLNGMRMAESCLLSMRMRIKGPSEMPDVEIPDGLAAVLSQNIQPAILVIDDAIDSGDTLFAIVETLKKTNPNAKVETAVITETTHHPRIRANYTLYQNRTLIRFPWSSDYKNP